MLIYVYLFLWEFLYSVNVYVFIPMMPFMIKIIKNYSMCEKGVFIFT